VFSALSATVFLLAGTVANGQLMTTRDDFEAPGTQPLSLTDLIATPETCEPCHSDYGSPEVEPFRNWAGSMMAQSGRDPLMWAAQAIAQQDALFSGETCLRCHLPKGWLEGRSVPESGTAMTADDRHGVQCGVCHRLVDPVANVGNPPEDAAILAALTAPVPAPGNAMMVIDPLDRRRGPFDIIADIGEDPHIPDATTLESPFHETSELCGTCHNVFNPVFTYDPMSDSYLLNTLGTPSPDVTKGFPEQTTYSEWLNSEYATTGVFAPQFGLNKDTVSSCQDCHMPDVSGKDAEFGADRTNLPLHQFRGANTFIPKVLPLHPVFGAEVDAALLLETVDIATEFLRKSASIALDLTGGNLTVSVTNETGHKLPTGYPEGRRMWLHVRAFDADRNVVYESGRYQFAIAEIVGYGAAMIDPDYDPDLHVWETVQGISPGLALTLGMMSGPSHHLTLNDTIEFDNRIPPRGFTNAAYEAFNGEPVGQAYADGQYWDDVVYPVGVSAVQAEVTLYYQTASKEYVEFLNDENVTNSAGPIMFDLWDQNGKSEPVVMANGFYEDDVSVVASCKKSLGKSHAKYAKKYAKEWARCYQKEADGLTCDSAGRDLAIADAAAGLTERVGGVKDKRCSAASLTPITLGHGPVCTGTCAELTIFNFPEIATCSLCITDALYGAALEAAYGFSPPALPGTAPVGDAGRCQEGIGKAAVGLAAGWNKALARCEDRNASGKNSPALDCAADSDGRIAKAVAKANKRIAKCSDFTGLAGCAVSGTVGGTQTCVEAAIADVVDDFTGVAYP
jgi:hypothetical protein